MPGKWRTCKYNGFLGKMLIQSQVYRRNFNQNFPPLETCIWDVAETKLCSRGCVTAVRFILFNFANYSPSIAMELKVSKEITGKWQTQRSETNRSVSWALFLKLQAAGINFERLLGWTVFKNPNFNPFQSSSVLPIRDICCFCYVILTVL